MLAEGWVQESAIAAGRSMWIQPQTSDLGSEVKQMEQISEGSCESCQTAEVEVTGVVEAYSLMAKAGQGLVWDAEKMDVIVNACQTDLFKARMDSNQV